MQAELYNEIVCQKILMIGGKVDLLALAREILEPKGYRVFCVLQGNADRLTGLKHPDLTILDLRMFGLEGIEILRQISQITQKDKKVRLVILPDLVLGITSDS